MVNFYQDTGRLIPDDGNVIPYKLKNKHGMEVILKWILLKEGAWVWTRLKCFKIGSKEFKNRHMRI